MHFVGIDTNSKQLAVTILNEDGSYFKAWMLPEKVKKGAEIRERLYIIADALRDFYLTEEIKALGPLQVYIEEVPRVNSVKIVVDLAYVVGQALVESHRAGGLVTPVNVSTWKHETVGHGRAEKPEIKAWAITNIPGMPEDLVQDIYDSACVARFAWKNAT